MPGISWVNDSAVPNSPMNITPLLPKLLFFDSAA